MSKGCGRTISIDVSENPALLEILEHLRTQNKPIVSNNAKNTASCNDVLASLGINIDDTTITDPRLTSPKSAKTFIFSILELQNVLNAAMQSAVNAKNMRKSITVAPTMTRHVRILSVYLKKR